MLILYYHSCASVGDIINANLCDNTFDFVVQRENMLNDALMQIDSLSYSPDKKLSVWYQIAYVIYECDTQQKGQHDSYVYIANRLNL